MAFKILQKIDENGYWIKPVKFFIAPDSKPSKKMVEQALPEGADVQNNFYKWDGEKWVAEKKPTSAEELIGRFLARGLRQVICTDISRDGMLCGPATGLYAALQQRFPDVEITVSGGVSAWRDLETLERAGLRSAIVGKAIYEGRITLKELKRCLQNE